MQVWAEEGEFGIMLVNFEESIVLRVNMSRKQHKWGSEESMGWGQRFDGAQLTGWNRNLSALLSSKAPCFFHSLPSHSTVFLCLCLFYTSPHPSTTTKLLLSLPTLAWSGPWNCLPAQIWANDLERLDNQKALSTPSPTVCAINPQLSLIFICYLPTRLCPFYLFFCLGRAQMWFFAGRVRHHFCVI